MADVNTALIDNYLQTLWQREGTDVLLVAGAPPMMRIDGEIERIDEPPAAARGHDPHRAGRPRRRAVGPVPARP